jgi:hypothetical protein
MPASSSSPSVHSTDRAEPRVDQELADHQEQPREEADPHHLHGKPGTPDQPTINPEPIAPESPRQDRHHLYLLLTAS